MLEEGANYLPKPFSRDQLLRAVQQALSSKTAAAPPPAAALA
jgi:DNA-binding response OmpR family regulator